VRGDVYPMAINGSRKACLETSVPAAVARKSAWIFVPRIMTEKFFSSAGLWGASVALVCGLVWFHHVTGFSSEE
jgi:hypothetical protein